MMWLKQLISVSVANLVLGLVVFSTALSQEAAIEQIEPLQTPDPVAPFAYSPTPRWTSEPDREQVCEAVRKECAKAWKGKQGNYEIGYDMIYAANGDVIGMRITQSSTCKPIDEVYQIFKRSMIFTPRLEGMHVELDPGVRPEDVRIIKSDITNYAYSCN
jgi:hypothetical protein